MSSASDVAELAFDLADGCRWIMEPLRCLLGGPSSRSPAVDAALIVLLTAYLACIIVALYAGVALTYLNLHAPAPAPAAGGSFTGMVFKLVSAWLLVFAVMLAAFFFVAAVCEGLGRD